MDPSDRWDSPHEDTISYLSPTNIYMYVILLYKDTMDSQDWKNWKKNLLDTMHHGCGKKQTKYQQLS